jgi:leukotriene-A4 hydrolase
LINSIAVNKGAVVVLRVTFVTSSASTAINWLKESQTTTKTLKYLFTQSEPAHGRGIVPMQDTPSVRTTYQAHVTVKDPYIVKMSANETEPTHNADGTTTFNF